MTGKDLFQLTMQDFQKIVPSDPGDVFWTHLELLRKMKVVGKLFKLKMKLLLFYKNTLQQPKGRSHKKDNQN